MQMFNFGGDSTGGGALKDFNFGMTGTNQYGGFLSPGSGGMSGLSGSSLMPGIVPQQGSNPFTPSGTAGQTAINSPYTPYAPSVNSQYYYGSTYDPNFTTQLEQFLNQNIGMGVTPFNLQSALPTGGTTQAGQLSAPNNQILQNLYGALTTGNFNNVPGLNTLNQFSQTGMPIDQTPAWQAMVDSMQRQIGKGAANLKEQFNVGGGLVGSPYGSATSDYFSQTTKDLNAQLLGAQTQALEAARQRQMTAGQDLTGVTTNMGQLFQGLDQASIDRLLQEFIRVSPQSNPLINAQYGLATTFPPYMAKESNLTGLGAVIGNLGPMLGGAISGGLGAAGGGGGALATIAGVLAGLCWVSRAIYGDDSEKVPVIRRFLVHWGAKSDEGMKMLRWYIMNGPAVALLIKIDPRIGEMFRPLFDQFYQLGLEMR